MNTLIDIKDFHNRVRHMTETELLQSYFYFNDNGDDYRAGLAAYELENTYGHVMTDLVDTPDNSDLLEY